VTVRRIAAEDLLGRLQAFDTVIDARSPAEHALDHLPGAVNWPTLDDAQRAQVGTEYAQVSPFEARKRGAAMAARNIAAHIERELPRRERGWRPLVYCWRGGQRSGSLATVLDAIGFTVHVVEGGYRAFRRAMLADLEVLPQTLQFRVLCGRTGSAKSRLLQALQAEGAQVLDLEALACHRGSVLGLVPGDLQPGQKAFERQVWVALRQLDPSRPVFVESESRTIGKLRLPETLLQRMRASPCLHLQMPLARRVHFLLQDYAHFVTDTQALCGRLQALTELRGAATVQRWQALARSGESGDLALMVQELLEQHYDPVYLKSMQRNFAGFEEALAWTLPDAEAPTLQAAAAALRAALDPPPPPHPAPPLLPEVKPQPAGAA
jgi:tRNA 2-selenouridine synthase